MPCSLNRQALSLAQLAIRTGKFAKGDALIPSITKKSAFLVLYSSLLGNNTRKKVLNKCAFYNIPVFEIDAADFDRISSKSGLAFALLDQGMADRLLEELDRKQNGGGFDGQ